MCVSVRACVCVRLDVDATEENRAEGPIEIKSESKWDAEINVEKKNGANSVCVNLILPERDKSNIECVYMQNYYSDTITDTFFVFSVIWCI